MNMQENGGFRLGSRHALPFEERDPFSLELGAPIAPVLQHGVIMCLFGREVVPDDEIRELSDTEKENLGLITDGE